MIRAWTASLLLHLLLAGMLLSLGQSLSRPRPLSIEVELVSAPIRQPSAADTAVTPAPPPQTPGKPAVNPLPPSLKSVKQSAPRPVESPVAKAPPASWAQPGTPQTDAALSAAQEPAPPAAVKLNTASAPSEPPEARTPTTAPRESPGPDGATASDLGPQVEDIRDRVMAALRYPPMARRQGWRGVVRIEFTLLSSGHVQDLRILQSSGYPLLDRQALRAVETAAPFSPPATAATITLPIRFRLE